MKAGRFYLDTSVYLGMLLGEMQALPYSRLTAGASFCSSVILLIEAERNLVRMSREKTISEEDYQTYADRLREDKELFMLREVTLDLCLTADFPAVKLPRSSDLIHLRTARWFQENGGLEGFVTLDADQRSAAREFGLPVI